MITESSKSLAEALKEMELSRGGRNEIGDFQEKSQRDDDGTCASAFNYFL